MATSVPPEPLWPAEASPAEQALWRWAIEQLPDRVRVLPGVHLTDPGDGQRDCEVDVVLIDPDWGVLVVEVKGGAVSYDARHRRWWRQLSGGRRREVRDPVEQAQRAASFVRRALAAHDIVAGGSRWAGRWRCPRRAWTRPAARICRPRSCGTLWRPISSRGASPSLPRARRG